MRKGFRKQKDIFSLSRRKEGKTWMNQCLNVKAIVRLGNRFSCCRGFVFVFISLFGFGFGFFSFHKWIKIVLKKGSGLRVFLNDFKFVVGVLTVYLWIGRGDKFQSHLLSQWSSRTAHDKRLWNWWSNVHIS